jgi:hypothetical protein
MSTVIRAEVCQRLRSYPDKAAADAAIRWLGRQQKLRGLSVFPCPANDGNHWHIGRDGRGSLPYRSDGPGLPS